MNNLNASIKLNFYILKSLFTLTLLATLVVSVIAAVISYYPSLVIGIILMTSAFSMTSIFSVSEKNNLDSLYGALPVRRREIVIGRFLLALLIGVVNAVLGIMLTLAISFIFNIEVSSLEIIGWVCGSFFLFCLIVSIQFPIYFRYDFSKVSAIANTPIIILFVGCSALIKTRPELYSQTIDFFIDNQHMIWIIWIGGALLLVGLSSLVSSLLFERRDF